MATEDATTPLLDSYPPSSHTRILPIRYTPIEVVIVLYFLSISCLFPVQQYYVISVVAKEYNESGFINHGAADCKKNVTHRTETKSVGDIIDEKSTEILMYLGFCSTFLSVAPIIFLGSVADRLGRKSVICLCLSGLILKEIINIIVIHFQLSLNFLFMGQVIEGLTGSFGALMMVLFGMTADITSPGKNRALRISVVEGIAAITYSIGTLGIGYWIRYGGFYYPMLFIITLTILCILFCVLFIPETSQFRNSGDTFFSTTYLLRSFRLYTDKSPSGRHWKLLTGLFILAMSGAAILGRSGTVTLYLMRHPFCWNAVKVQVFSSIQTFVNWGAVIVVVRVLHVFMQDYGILVIGSISATLAFLFLSLATHDWMVYMFVVVGICSSSVFPVIRAFMSRQCKPEDQGSLFASISGTELLFTAFSQLLYGGVYKASVSFYPGLVFLIMTGVLFIVVIVSILNYRWMKRDNNLTQTWETIN